MSHASREVWVFVEQRGGKPADVSFELLSKGRKLADAMGGALTSVVIGDDVRPIAAETFGYGVDEALRMRCQTTDGPTLTGKRPKPEKYPRLLKTLGDHLLKKRLDLGLMQKVVATQFGVDPTSIRYWERNRTKPAIRFMPRIIEFLGYNPLPPRSDSIGNRILHHRKTHGISQEQLARQLGIDPGTLGKVERHQTKPFPSTVGKIVEFLSKFSD